MGASLPLSENLRMRLNYDTSFKNDFEHTLLLVSEGKTSL